jgi:hypothetical protein
VFVQIPTMQAQETADYAKITCEQLIMGALARSSHEVVVWINGYYNGKRNNTIIDLQTAIKDEEAVREYCYQHQEATVMDAAKNVLGFDK